MTDATTIGRRKAAAIAADALGATGRCCVYYGRRADGVIKIGNSWHVADRMYALRLELLAVEFVSFPFGRALERERHRQFAALHVDGEYFQPGNELLAHIDSLKAAS